MTDIPTPDTPEVEDAPLADAPADMETLQRELEQARAQHQRALADYQNLERRSREDRADVGRIALANVVVSLLPALDDLQRAIESIGESSDSSSWIEGVRLVEQKFTQALEQHGLREIHALGQPFDPAFHEAVGAAPGPENQVVHLLRRGYTLKDRVVRPAMVMVGNGETES